MKKVFTILVAIVSFLFSKAQFNNSSIILKRNYTINFEKDTVFGFAINPSLIKTNLAWKGRNDAELNQFAEIIKSRCETDSLFCNIYKYVPICDHSPTVAVNVLENIKMYLIRKCKIPSKNITTVTLVGGGPENIEYKGKVVPYIEIILSKETL